METENINVDEFLPAKNTIKLKNIKRKAVSELDGMEVEEQSVTQGKAKRNRSRAKRPKKPSEPNESKVNMRKVPVPAHRYITSITNKYINKTYYQLSSDSEICVLSSWFRFLFKAKNCSKTD